MAAVTAHPAFQADPFAAVRQHLENTLPPPPAIKAGGKKGKGQKAKMKRKKNKTKKAGGGAGGDVEMA